MTRQKAEKINKLIDLVHLQMVHSGYDTQKLNKAFVVFNITQLTDEVEAFNFVVNQLIKMNEAVENYEICVFLQDIKKQINRTRK